MTAFSPPEQLPLCQKCQNRGYYQLHVQPLRAGDNPTRTVMFCACEAGKQLRLITIEFRLGDLVELSDFLLIRLRKCSDLLHEPDKAGKELIAIIDHLLDLQTKLRQAERDAGIEKVE